MGSVNASAIGCINVLEEEKKGFRMKNERSVSELTSKLSKDLRETEQREGDSEVDSEVITQSPCEEMARIDS